MNRDEAILIVSRYELAKLSPKKREEMLLDWWTVDNTDPEFSKLPEELQKEILQSDEPVSNVMDQKYDLLLIEGLRHNYIGVKNEYLSKRVSEILCSKVCVEGQEEILFPCPCCKYQTFLERGQYEVCPVCFWEDDGSNEPTRYSSVNQMTLGDGQVHFKEYGAVSKKSLQFIKPDVKFRYNKSGNCD
ncbi:CPCC family cysteine-rich protein [Paludifilum halophilum]|uniref:Cysteine-rich CPCC domain-containing protein n=1 Tax=Paludifilum halophilum TaxID=1642702 RepID=A0A235B2R5_9BACL|nr:CPCC family cysteine-rich protein [Paludifilum halophilum]OYD06598.1 hypothetical protein CHM34_16025 [Paludifilum halophilum]